VVHQLFSAYLSCLSVLGGVKQAVKDVSQLDYPIDPTHDHINDHIVIYQGFQACLSHRHPKVSLVAQANWIGPELFVSV
jgi:hypothetical protein